jgi:hypothetical protein
MLKIIFAYILAWLSMSLLSSLISMAFLPLTLLGRRIKAAAPVITFVTSYASMFLALLIFVWVCVKIEVQPTYLMFVIPYFAVVSNNFKRVDNARKSNTIIAQAVGEDYDPKLQVKMEYGYMAGDVLGWLTFLLSQGRMPLY